MAISLGGADFSAIYKGSSPVKEVWQGSNQVWPSGGMYSHVAYFQGAADGSNPKNITVTLGEEHPDRWIIVCLSQDIASGSSSVSALTVGGVSFAKGYEATNGSRHSVCIWYGKVPTGTTATMTITGGSYNISLPLGTIGQVKAKTLTEYNKNGQVNGAGVVVAQPNMLTIAHYATGSGGSAGVNCSYTSSPRTPIENAYLGNGSAQGTWVGAVQPNATGAGGTQSINANPSFSSPRAALSMLTLSWT